MQKERNFYFRFYLLKNAQSKSIQWSVENPNLLCVFSFICVRSKYFPLQFALLTPSMCVLNIMQKINLLSVSFILNSDCVYTHPHTHHTLKFKCIGQECWVVKIWAFFFVRNNCTHSCRVLAIWWYLHNTGCYK
jgi:hypothetical protein